MNHKSGMRFPDGREEKSDQMTIEKKHPTLIFHLLGYFAIDLYE